jgi:F-type H+-transporting ATPase subunit epsilon
MYLEIISPEKVLFRGEVSSVSVPGANGDFQMLDHHAAILSTLREGVVKFEVSGSDNVISDDISANGNTHTLEIKGGVIEMSNNKATVLPS